MTDSQQLLAAYVQNGSEDAFRELLTRYLDLVYSTALRLVEGDTHRAEDVAQTVFVDLTRQARALSAEVRLGGWLHRHTCFVAAKTMRGERRRQSRERQAVEMNALESHSETNFSLVAPLLDEAINELSDEDRTAILLRFFEQQNFRAVGEALGSNEDAARMRVNRALEKLESLLKRRGVTMSAAALGVALSANVIQAAPIGLSAAITAACALAATTIATTATVTATKAIVMTTLQKTLIATIVVAGLATSLFIQRQAQVKLGAENKSLRQQVAQLAQLQAENLRLSNLVAELKSSPKLADDQFHELLRLRGEVNVLRRQLDENGDVSRNVEISSALKAALAKLRASTSESEALGTIQLFRPLSPAPEIFSELAQIMKANKLTARAIAMGDIPLAIAGYDVVIHGKYVPQVEPAFKPLLQDSDAKVRQAAAYVMAQVLKGRAGLDVIPIAIEDLKSTDDNTRVEGFVLLGNAGEDPNHPKRRVTTTSLGSAAGEVTAALLEIVRSSQRGDVRDSALRLLQGLEPDLTRTDSSTATAFKEYQQMSAFVEKTQSGQASVPEIIDGLKQFPKSILQVANVLIGRGKEAQSALPTLRDLLPVLAPKPDAITANR